MIEAEIGRVLLLSTVGQQQRGLLGKRKSDNGRRVVADTDGRLPALMANKREREIAMAYEIEIKIEMKTRKR
ncbi:hypothetical protein L484_020192 [Morus notabilis]|uniref:Uncharacterized protein n=1 Tax=Morus notabilis TaxID=981085 RepID=W9R9Y9_9ROSA|nr:hypothetical protein L484_020192 [Morus notabilis]